MRMIFALAVAVLTFNICAPLAVQFLPPMLNWPGWLSQPLIAIAILAGIGNLILFATMFFGIRNHIGTSRWLAGLAVGNIVGGLLYLLWWSTSDIPRGDEPLWALVLGAVLSYGAPLSNMLNITQVWAFQSRFRKEVA